MSEVTTSNSISLADVNKGLQLFSKAADVEIGFYTRGLNMRIMSSGSGT